MAHRSDDAQVAHRGRRPLAGLGVFIPPIGVGLFVACSIARLPPEQALRPFAPYLGVLFAALMVISYVPEITLFTPRLLFGR